VDLIPIIETLLQGVSLNDWTVSHNHTRKGPVTEARVGVRDGTTFWARFKFQEDGTAHAIEAERSFTGGPATITLDGAAIAGGHIALSKHIKGFLPPHLSVEIDIDLPTAVGQYRFDAQVS
jgi:hypothetical protein